MPSKGFWGKRAFVSGEQGNEGLKLKRTREQRQFGEQGTYEIKLLILGHMGFISVDKGTGNTLGGPQQFRTTMTSEYK